MFAFLSILPFNLGLGRTQEHVRIPRHGGATAKSIPRDSWLLEAVGGFEASLIRFLLPLMMDLGEHADSHGIRGKHEAD